MLLHLKVIQEFSCFYHNLPKQQTISFNYSLAFQVLMEEIAEQSSVIIKVGLLHLSKPINRKVKHAMIMSI